MKNDISIQEQSDRYVIAPGGLIVSRCVVDRNSFTVECVTSSDELLMIRAESDISFVSDGRVYSVFPERDPTSVGPLLAVLLKQVKSVAACKTGRLELEFDDGSSLYVDPDDDYEAWEITAGKSIRVVCGPGGVLSVWT